MSHRTQKVQRPRLGRVANRSAWLPLSVALVAVLLVGRINSCSKSSDSVETQSMVADRPSTESAQAGSPAGTGPQELRTLVTSDPGETCLVTVVEAPTEIPVAGARISTLETTLGDGTPAVAQDWLTNEFGQARIPLTRNPPGVTVEATAPGFESHRSTLKPEQSTLRIALRPLGELKGVVLWRGGRGPVSGVHVLVFDSTTRTPDPEAALFAPNTDRFARATSDLDGRFTLTGLQASRRYFLLAGAPGIVLPSMMANLQVDGQEAKVEVTHAYGAMLQLADSQSGAFDFPEHNRDSLRYETSTADPNSKPLVLFPAAAALAGVPVDALALGPGVIIRLFGSDDGTPSSGPHRIELHVPCYQDLDTEFLAQRLDLGLEHTTLQLTRSCDGWGEVTLMPRGLSPAMRTRLDSHPLDMLLDLESSESRKDTFLFQFAGMGSRQVSGLPVDSRLARARTRDGLFAWSFPSTAVVRSGPTEHEVDFSQTGLIGLRLMTPAGVALTEEVNIMLSSGPPELGESGRPRFRNTRFLLSQGGDRALGPIQAGLYSLVLPAALFSGAPSGRHIVTVQVDAGSVTTVEVQL